MNVTLPALRIAFVCALTCLLGEYTSIQAQSMDNPGMMILRFCKRADYFVTANAGMYVFPSGLKQPTFGIDIPASKIGPLADVSWGWTGWLGKVMITQSLGIKLWQINIPNDAAAQIQAKSNNVSMGVGYTVVDDPIFRLTPILSFGFSGIKLIDNPVNSYVSLGGELDASVILPLLPTVGRGNTFAVVASLLSVRLGYLENFSSFTSSPVQNEIVARITIGFGLHTNYENELQPIEQ
jgi:hypothetical protein